MGLLDRLFVPVQNAYEALRGGSASRVPDGAIVIDPMAALRWTVAYTPERLDQIKTRRALAELIQLGEDILTDDRIRAVADERAESLIGAEIEFTKGQGRRSGRALRAAAAEADLWEMLPEPEHRQVLTWGVLANFGTARKRWWELARDGKRYVPRRRNGRIVPRVEFWHPRTFRLDATTRQWFAKVETPDSTVPVDRAMSWGDGEFIAFCPWGGRPGEAVDRGLLFPAAKLWLLKQYVIRDGASLSGRMSTPIKVLEYVLVQQGTPVPAEGGADSKRKQLVDEIFAMQKRGVVSLPPGFTMKLLSMPATSWQMLKEQWTACNDAFAILWTGNNLTTSIQGGSLAASDNAQKQFSRKLRNDANSESTFVHDDVLGDWSEVNFADREAAPWPSRNVEPPEDLKARAATWLSLSQAVSGFEKNGWILDKESTAETFELPLVAGQPNTGPPKKPDTATPPNNGQVPNAA